MIRGKIFLIAILLISLLILVPYLPWFKTAMTIFWSIFVAIPVTWFIMKIFSREPAHYFQRRY